MDGPAGVWHAGPFSNSARFRFYPKDLPMSAPTRLRWTVNSRHHRSQAQIRKGDFHLRSIRIAPRRQPRSNFNAFIREPGHVEYASKLGLGIYDDATIQFKAIEL